MWKINKIPNQKAANKKKWQNWIQTLYKVDRSSPLWWCDFLHEACLHFPSIIACTATPEVSAAHTHPHTTPISSLPQQRAVGAGQLRQSIDCSAEEGEKKEPQAMSSGRGEDLSKITAPGAFLPHTGKARAQTAATSLPHRAPSPTERKNVNLVKSMLSAGQLYSRLILSIRLLEMQVSSLGKHW